MTGIRIKELYESAKRKYRLKLHCGKDGLENSAAWVYLAEDIHNMSFLKGGELIITTGLFTRDGVGLYDFIRALALYNCSGILINAGQYLYEKDITPEIRSFCDVNRIPLFTMPWEIHLADIMQEFCRIFFQDRQAENDLNAAFQSAVYQEKTSANVLRTLNQFGFPTQTPYIVAVIRNLSDVTSIASPLNRSGLRYHLFPHRNHHVLIYGAAQGRLSDDEIVDMVCYCDSITLGVSNAAPSLAEIGTAYRRACFSLAAAEFWKRPFARFSELGVFQFLFSCANTGLLESYSEKYLGALEKYDQQHNTDYLDTLRVFLAEDCNLLKTAAKLHMHRNTVVYRINRIKTLLRTELDTSAIKFNLMLAFYVREFFQM